MPEIPLVVEEYLAAQSAADRTRNRLSSAVRRALSARVGGNDVHFDGLKRLITGDFLVSYYRYGYPGFRFGEGQLTLSAAELHAWVSGEDDAP